MENNIQEKTIVYQPTSLTEMQTLLKNNQQILPLAACTEFLQGQPELSFSMPKYLVSLLNLKELQEVNKTERYLDLGAMVTLERILDLGEKNIPPLLYSSIQTIASKNLRTLATLGGNIAITHNSKTLYPILITLDTRIEIKNGTETFWEPYAKYASDDFIDFRSKPHVITRVRIYSENWTHNFFRRLGKKGLLDNKTAYFIFLVKVQKNLITDIRISFTDTTFYRSREFEDTILGRTIPFDRKDLVQIIETSKKFFTSEHFNEKFKELIFFNLLEKCLLDLK